MGMSITYLMEDSNHGKSHFKFENHKIPYDWNKIFSTNFFDKNLFKSYQERIDSLLKFLPKEKYLVHGDFGFDNLLIDENSISGVIDWAEAKLGDYLFDLAWLDFWSENICYSSSYKKLYENEKMDTKNFEERLECYYLVVGLNSLIISAHLNKTEDYNFVHSR